MKILARGTREINEKIFKKTTIDFSFRNIFSTIFVLLAGTLTLSLFLIFHQIKKNMMKYQHGFNNQK